MRRVKSHIFGGWSQTLVDAANHLPEDTDWPHELYILLAENVPREARRLVMWTERDIPIGIAAFAQDTRGTWEPVTQWLVPGMLGMSAAPRIGSLIARLPFPADVAWWRMLEPVPAGGNIRMVAEEPTFGMSCSADFEAYWKQTDQFRAIRKARDRCKHLTVSVNPPGAREWVLQQSERHWRPRGHIAPSHQLRNRLLATRYMETLGKSVTIALQDGAQFVAAELCIVHRRELVMWNTFRDRRYDDCGLGNRGMELAYYWARNNNLVGVDIGGGFRHYKSRWAPKSGTKATLRISPLIRHAEDQARRVMSYAWSVVTCYLANLRGAERDQSRT